MRPSSANGTVAQEIVAQEIADRPAPAGRHRPEVALPLDLSNNDGTYMPEACVRLLAQRRERTSLRRYSSPTNAALLHAIAQREGVTPAHVLLHTGSGPILKQVIPDLIRRAIQSSPWRVVRHLVNKSGYPIVTPLFTYGKVPLKAAEVGLTVRVLHTGPEQGFRVSPDAISAHLRRQPGLVYLVNPNNPSGNVTISRESLEPLLVAHRDSFFWVDEAYVEYCPAEHPSFAPLVARHPNLAVSRSFSFAWGLAGAKVGYLLASPEVIARENRKLTEHRLGALAEDLCVAALSDPRHLPWLRAVCEDQRTLLSEGFAALGLTVFPSVTNFLLCRREDGGTGAELAARLATRGIQIKVLRPFAGEDFAPYFRVTLGLGPENRLLLEVMAQALGA